MALTLTFKWKRIGLHPAGRIPKHRKLTMHFSDLKIRTKISLGFGALVLIAVLLGLTAVSKLKAVSTASETIGQNNLPSVQLAAAMRDYMAQMRRAEARNLLATTPADLEESESAFARNHKSLEKLEDKQVALFDSVKERSLLEAYRKHSVQWLELADKLHTATRKEGTTEAIKKMYLGDSAHAFDAALGDLTELSEYNARESDAAVKESTAIYQSAVAFMVGGIGLATILSLFFAWAISRAISAPMEAAVLAARAMAEGDMGAEIRVHGRDETGQLLGALEAMRKGLSAVVIKVRSGSESVATAAAQIAQGNSDLSGRTEQQASALEETTANMKELGATVRQNADTARQANQLAANASSVAVSGGQVVGEVVETMKGINESSRRISDIISVIDGIAFQTNILALNAAVEAARAGEQGRGFAVVASEVRSLAGRSAEAAKEIKSLINASVERVEQGTTLVDKAGSTMTEVVGSIRRVTDLVGEISAASTEQATGMNQMGDAVNAMDQVTQQNAALVEEMAAAASSLKSQAIDLVEVVAYFKVGSDAQRNANPPSARHFAQEGTVTMQRRRPSMQTASRKPITSTPINKPQPRSLPSQKSNSENDAGWETF